jgi:hypothetical protein
MAGRRLTNRPASHRRNPMTMRHDAGRGPLLEEAARELESAIHDARVAFDCIGLGELDRAQESAVTARVAIDAALTILQTTLQEAQPWR